MMLLRLQLYKGYCCASKSRHTIGRLATSTKHGRYTKACFYWQRLSCLFLPVRSPNPRKEPNIVVKPIKTDMILKIMWTLYRESHGSQGRGRTN